MTLPFLEYDIPVSSAGLARVEYTEADRYYRGLRPHTKQDGVYVLSREPFSTEVRFREPSGDSYLLPYFTLRQILRVVLKMEDDASSCLLDRLWNFGTIAYEPSTGRMVPVNRRRQVVAPTLGPGW